MLSMSHPDSGVFILQPGMGCAEVVQGPSGAVVDAWAAPGEGSAVSTSGGGGVLSPPEAQRERGGHWASGSLETTHTSAGGRLGGGRGMWWGDARLQVSP